MEKVWLSTAPYDGGWYAFLIEVHSHKTIKESDLYTNELLAVTELRKWAKNNNRVILWQVLYKH